jgi:hypothetical protein
MGDILTEVERWRMKAEELFAVAENLTNEAARSELLQMAESYIRLADRMEDVAAKKLAENRRRGALGER